jgi:hypothetical protein
VTSSGEAMASPSLTRANDTASRFRCVAHATPGGLALAPGAGRLARTPTGIFQKIYYPTLWAPWTHLYELERWTHGGGAVPAPETRSAGRRNWVDFGKSRTLET